VGKTSVILALFSMLYPVRIVTWQSERIFLTASVARWLWPKSAK